MYPPLEMLQEVGRVTIAGSRLDIQMGVLWHCLDRSLDLTDARRASGGVQGSKVAALARTRLRDPLQTQVLAAVEEATVAREKRNQLVHQDWVLQGADATRPFSEIAAVPLQDLARYEDEWRRESKASADWRRIPARTIDADAVQELRELEDLERELAAVCDKINELSYKVAAALQSLTGP